MVATTDALMERARTSAGLDDFGPDGWFDGLAHLVEAVARDVGDDDATVRRIEALIVGRLVNRLRVEAWCADHRAEVAQPIDGLLVIVGLPRTATTALHYFLAVDRQFRHLRAWEVNDPVPAPDVATEHDDPRRPAAPPPADIRHIATVDGPAEDWPIHAMAFDHAELTLPVPSHTSWWRARNHDALLPYHARVLQLQHSRRPPRRWLLKMPAYLFLLPETAAHYRDAKFVMTHRDLVASIASTCSTVADARRKRTPAWTQEPGFGRFLLEHWRDGMGRAMAARNAMGDHRFLDVAQRDLEADPIGVAERIYDFASLELGHDVREGMSSWVLDNRRGARGVHQYRPEDFDLSATEITDAFAPYLERFGAYCR